MTDIQAKSITAFSNPIIKRLRGFALKKNRDAEEVFLGEGLKLVTDALDAAWPIETLVICSNVADQPKVREAVHRVQSSGGRIVEVPEAILAKITRRDNPQMVVGVFQQRLRALTDLSSKPATVFVALESIKDPGNLGTIIRTCDAVGAAGVILVGATCDPWSVEAVRATMGSLFHVPIVKSTTSDVLAWSRDRGYSVIGTHLAGAVDYRSPNYAEPTVLLMGNEQSGLPTDVANQCDILVKIPQIGQADSLNLAVSTGVMLYEVRRSRL